MSWSDRSGDPLPAGHPERRGRRRVSSLRGWVAMLVAAITGRRRG